MIRRVIYFCAIAIGLLQGAAQSEQFAPSLSVLEAERQRIETIESISLPTLAIIDSSGQGVGSGVVISADGYALTNFHVSSACGPAMKCGMVDGQLYDAVIVGIDPTGDVALIKLFGREDFPAATIGNSDSVRVGEWAYVVGNPFALADDYQPSVTFGIISGVHRYQYPSGTHLEYADCLQTDAAINPGNSGGPLFDDAGRLIGINGRGSFEKRGRVNVGVGYAISINQIMRFLGCLKSGRIVDHASLAATVAADERGRIVVDEVLDESDVYRRGLRYGDEILRFGHQRITTVNEFKNALGTYPNQWRIPLTFRQRGEQVDCLVRLTGHHREGELTELLKSKAFAPPESDNPEHPDKPAVPRKIKQHETKSPPEMPEVVANHFETRRGFANYWFNRHHQDRIFRGMAGAADAIGNAWAIRGITQTGGEFSIEITADEATMTLPTMVSSADFSQLGPSPPSPPKSGGLLSAIRLWQRMLKLGPAKFGHVVYFGSLPWTSQTELADCLVAYYGGSECRFYTDPTTGELLGIEYFSNVEADPCEIYFGDTRSAGGIRLPHQWTIRHADGLFDVLEIVSFEVSIGTQVN